MTVLRRTNWCFVVISFRCKLQHDGGAQDELEKKRAVLDSVAGKVASIMAAAEAPCKELDMQPPAVSCASWGDGLKLAGPLQVIRSQLIAANTVFSLGLKVCCPSGTLQLIRSQVVAANTVFSLGLKVCCLSLQFRA